MEWNKQQTDLSIAELTGFVPSFYCQLGRTSELYLTQYEAVKKKVCIYVMFRRAVRYIYAL